MTLFTAIRCTQKITHSFVVVACIALAGFSVAPASASMIECFETVTSSELAASLDHYSNPTGLIRLDGALSVKPKDWTNIAGWTAATRSTAVFPANPNNVKQSVEPSTSDASDYGIHHSSRAGSGEHRDSSSSSSLFAIYFESPAITAFAFSGRLYVKEELEIQPAPASELLRPPQNS